MELQSDLFIVTKERVFKGLPLTEEAAQDPCRLLVSNARNEFKEYEAYHTRKLASYSKVFEAMKKKITQLQDIKDGIIADLGQEGYDVPESITEEMLQYPEWRKVQKTILEQKEAKFRFHIASFKDDNNRNELLIATETLIHQNIHERYNTAIYHLFAQ